MASKILGLDLGTNSIGICVRNAEKSADVIGQMEYFSSIIFPSGVGKDKSGEFSYAAERTVHRSSRRLYMSRKYRIWRTLEVLIDNGYCPLSKEDLDRWRKYDKAKGLKREYPIDATAFEQWVRLDFDGDGLPEYSSPYQLRAELMARQFDFTDPTERYKLGRALYHIAQRRGFKSSKGDSAAMVIDDEDGGLKKSEEERSKDLVEYMQQNGCPTIGCAFAKIENDGLRVRQDYLSKVVRAQYEEEIRQIFTFQEGISTNTPFFHAIISRKEGEGSIFYKRPLRSQKGTVGKCTLEPSKSRCPQSRPEYELFRAWSLINNIRYATKDEGKDRKPMHELTLEQKHRLFESRFLLSRASFKFDDLTKYLEKTEEIKAASWNYPAQTSVSGCPVIYRLKDLLGEDWPSAKLNGHYTYEDLWHVCFTADESEDIHDFVVDCLHGDAEQEKKMLKLWGTVAQGYAELSLKAINLIRYFLERGYIYSDAVVLAKVPALFGSRWTDIEAAILGEWEDVKMGCNGSRKIGKVVNQLIADYKMLEPEDQFAIHNTDYLLTDDDRLAVRSTAIKVLSKEVWKAMSDSEQQDLLARVADGYQCFFNSEKRDYVRIPHLNDYLEAYLVQNYAEYFASEDDKQVISGKHALYHPSVGSIYQKAERTTFSMDGHLVSMRLLNSPATNVFRNPMVMRVLHTLRSKINELIKAGIIDEYTQVVVETAREFNDANMRAAIEIYQRQREKENAAYCKDLEDYLPANKITETDIEKARLWSELPSDKEVEKVRLWSEQEKRCIYTGKLIRLSDLLNGDKFEIEHTLPRSLSYDDSLANKTICDYHFNRYEKKTLLPSELPNYADILLRLEPWRKKCEALKKQITTCNNRVKGAATKEDKDRAIRDRHVLRMQLEYWQDKLSRFMVKRDQLNLGFRHSQLNDTRIITKYAFHFLKTVFSDVTVQRGDMTASFRKAFGLQSVDEKKDRSLHAHHAIDAAVLTLIPTNQKRDDMLDAFYCMEEAARFNMKDEAAEKRYHYLLNTCNIKHVDDLPEFIQQNILVQHDKRDQTLTPSSRLKRVRGKVVRIEGKPIVLQGDTLRGQLHQETWYGAIAPAILDKRGGMQRDEDGRIIVDTENLKYVVRRELKYKASSTDSGFSNWEELEKAIVNKTLVPMMQKQFPTGTSLKEACEKGIWMLDKQDQPVNRIRHIRCYAFVSRPLEVKQQTYRSKSEYKNHYYAGVGDMFGMAQYVEPKSGKMLYLPMTLFDVALNRKNAQEDILTIQTDKKGNRYNLRTVLKTGDMVLLYEKSIDELTAAKPSELSNRLYHVRGFETDGARIKLQRHLSAKPDKILGTGEPIRSFNCLPEKIRCGINTLHFLIKGLDFDITPKGVIFL